MNSAYAYFLQAIPGIGNKTLQSLSQYFGSVQAIYWAPETELSKLLKPKQLQNFLAAREKKDPETELKSLKAKGIYYYSIEDKNYPKRLRKIPQPPFGIFVRGSLPKEGNVAAAVIGTRNHSYYGEKMTYLYTGILAECGICVISGMARGIDGIAQNCVLQKGGQTYAVLGCGVDICYPPEHERLYLNIVKTGGIISEYLPGTRPASGLFPPRNRIISGMSDFILVMEAGEKSGTLITVDMALDQGKDILALPGKVDDPLSRGCNRLIRDGAYMLPEPEEFREQMKAYIKNAGVIKQAEAEYEKATQERKLSILETQILSVLSYEPLTLDEILRRIPQQETYSCKEVAVCLTELGLKNLVSQKGGTMFFNK